MQVGQLVSMRAPEAHCLRRPAGSALRYCQRKANGHVKNISIPRCSHNRPAYNTVHVYIGLASDWFCTTSCTARVRKTRASTRSWQAAAVHKHASKTKTMANYKNAPLPHPHHDPYVQHAGALESALSQESPSSTKGSFSNNDRLTSSARCAFV